ncbi:MAG: hypothetical protein LBD59_11315 [Prevotellaceae bacterium]|jgi:hypothetical protein|nr:hypothetical protein [Prevotellaceae bacterium]
MKKIGFILVAAWLISCGDIYKEETGATFEGTWSLVESYDYSGSGRVTVPKRVGKFITSRKIGGENFLLFYSSGTYDSSFFYRLQDSVIFVRRIMDSAEVKVDPEWMEDEEGNFIDENGFPIEPDDNGRIDRDKLVPKRDADGNIIWITEIRPQKPEDPKAESAPEKYFGAFLIRQGANMTMRIRRYAGTMPGDRGALLYEDIYERPVED